jgi:(p)ppGpp synthase/HD superfamily hydrolase
MDPANTSPRLATAFAYAEQIHRGQTRKKTRAPTISHLMAVASLVLENGGDEDEAIAALLHDGPEDCQGAETLKEIEDRFGGRVAQIVLGCTDSMQFPKPPWKERKSNYIARLAAADESTLLVSLADKVHNVDSLVVGYRQLGEELWDRFSAGRQQSLWYYESLLAVFQNADIGRGAVLVEALERSLGELRERIAAQGP